MTATYQAIAAAIGEHIVSGRLRPGDRVPSTREITRQWGVAVATATKALAALKADGLVRGVVGVGTVVADRPHATAPLPEPAAPPRRRPSAEAEPELTRDRIIRTAVGIADGEVGQTGRAIDVEEALGDPGHATVLQHGADHGAVLGHQRIQLVVDDVDLGRRLGVDPQGAVLVDRAGPDAGTGQTRDDDVPLAV